jgi:uncharacterized damage-inducible protein DinB
MMIPDDGNQRDARDTGEPPKTGKYGPWRWADYLDWVRTDVAQAVLALPAEAQRTSRVPSGWTPIELLSHVLHMEQRWFVWGFLGEQVDQPWGDWTRDEPWRDDDSDVALSGARWRVPDDVTAEELAERLAATGRRTREILLSHPLHAPGGTGGRFGADPPTLEWICFHVLAEYSRHAGQLDIVVELGADHN